MPRDRLAAMHQNAYLEDGDEFIPMEEDPEGPLKEFFKEIEEIRDNCEKVHSQVGRLSRSTALINIGCPLT